MMKTKLTVGSCPGLPKSLPCPCPQLSFLPGAVTSLFTGLVVLGVLIGPVGVIGFFFLLIIR
jgi:hypothetical protein